MPDERRYRCRICLRTKEEVGSISWRGRCVDCAMQRAEQSALQLHAHEGPYFDRWRGKVAASVGAVLLDDVGEAVQTRD